MFGVDRGKIQRNYFKRLPIDIKVVTEGNTVSVARDPLYTADHSYGYTVDMRIGVDVVVGTKFGALQLD